MASVQVIRVDTGEVLWAAAGVGGLISAVVPVGPDGTGSQTIQYKLQGSIPFTDTSTGAAFNRSLSAIIGKR